MNKIIKYISEGEELNMLYIPIYRDFNTMRVKCYLFIIAPFAWLYHKILDLYYFSIKKCTSNQREKRIYNLAYQRGQKSGYKHGYREGEMKAYSSKNINSINSLITLIKSKQKNNE